MKETTLVVVIGSLRGGNHTWNTMINNLLRPFNADLALLNDSFPQESNQNLLIEHAKYIWEMGKYNNWKLYYEQVCENQSWYEFFCKSRKSGIGGGIDDFKGSGAIIFAFRYFLKANFLNVLLSYDRIILTRSDYFYLQPHPVNNNDCCYVTEGEDYGGITDRHYIFPSTLSNKVLGIVEFIDKNAQTFVDSDLYFNPESLLKFYYQQIGIFDNIKRCMRVQFTTATKTDQTRWAVPSHYLPITYITNNEQLYIKYFSEYLIAKQNFEQTYFNPQRIYYPPVPSNEAYQFNSQTKKWSVNIRTTYN